MSIFMSSFIAASDKGADQFGPFLSAERSDFRADLCNIIGHLPSLDCQRH
jgi:hypothetical protein